MSNLNICADCGASYRYEHSCYRCLACGQGWQRVHHCAKSGKTFRSKPGKYGTWAQEE